MLSSVWLIIYRGWSEIFVCMCLHDKESAMSHEMGCNHWCPPHFHRPHHFILYFTHSIARTSAFDDSLFSFMKNRFIYLLPPRNSIWTERVQRIHFIDLETRCTDVITMMWRFGDCDVFASWSRNGGPVNRQQFSSFCVASSVLISISSYFSLVAILSNIFWSFKSIWFLLFDVNITRCLFIFTFVRTLHSARVHVYYFDVIIHY